MNGRIRWLISTYVFRKAARRVLVVAVDLGRIVEAPVERVVLAREDRA